MNFLDDKQLANYVTMRIGGPAKQITIVRNEQDVVEAVEFARSNNMGIISIGRGSNIIFGDDGFDGLVLINEISGIMVDEANNQITAGSGELTDDVVSKSVILNLTGIEALSGIPGTIGAAPVNNIGAYGQEIKDALMQVRAFDTLENKFVDILKEDCGFGYRDSIFKSKFHGRYIITKVFLQLKTDIYYQVPDYPSLRKALESRQIIDPTLAQIRQTILELRNAKLPDPLKLANTGSFFKNPIVEKARADELLIRYPDIIHYPQTDGREKLSAGWLIETAGLKNHRQNGFWVYDQQALVLINETSKSFSDLAIMTNFIIDKVREMFGVVLEIEPEIIR